jgi:hypothetical protein
MQKNEKSLTLEDRIGKASTIVEVLPYIKKFAGQMVVIKYGGSAICRGAPSYCPWWWQGNI